MTGPAVLAAPTVPRDAGTDERAARYGEVRAAIASLLDDEDDWVAAMASVVCELHHAFAYFDWTGFYRAVEPEVLIVGPYQGGHGCLRIPFGRGVCGAAAHTRETQVVPDVEAFSGHIACSSTTRSEIVVPVVTQGGALLAVLDIDSNDPSAFLEVDRQNLEAIAQNLGRRFPHLQP